jgi:hypothetical protein
MTDQTNMPPLITAEMLATDYAHLIARVEKIEASLAGFPLVIEDDEDLDLVTAKVKEIRREAQAIVDEGKPQADRYYHAHRTTHGFFHGLTDRLEAIRDKVAARGDAYSVRKRDKERAKQRAIEDEQRAEAEKNAAAAAEAARAGDTEAAKAALASSTVAEIKADSAAAAAENSVPTRTEAGTASLTDKLTFKIVDHNKLPGSLLFQFVSRPEQEKAIRAWCRLNKEAIIAGNVELTGVEFSNKPKGLYK